MNGDIINIDGVGLLCDFYVCESGIKFFLFSLIMWSYNMIVFIFCKRGGFWFMCNLRVDVFWEVFLKDIIFINILLYVVSCFVKVFDCFFINSFVFVLFMSFIGDLIIIV